MTDVRLNWSFSNGTIHSIGVIASGMLGLIHECEASGFEEITTQNNSCVQYYDNPRKTFVAA
jgi:hypothetical protein